MTTVKFNAEAARAAIRRAIHSLEDMTPVYEDLGDYMVDATRKRFLTGTAPDGSTWAPKSDKTLERYRQRGYGGILNKPLIGPSKALSRQIQKVVSRGGVAIGSSQIYSGVMQDGAAKGAFGSTRTGRPIPFGRIPARIWLGLSSADELAIVEIVDEHLAAGLDAKD